MLIATTLVSNAALSQSPDPDPGPVERGRLLFRIHCQSCHGEQGLGDGPLAEDLRVAPANLRTIAERRNGTYPRAEIHQVIDGRMVLRGHGGSQMPIWGLALLDRESDSMREQDIEQRIEDLVDFLESIQTARAR